jgi:hypothetical protein
MTMKFLLPTLCLALAACSGKPEILIVKQFTLRDQETNKAGDPMIQNERLRRLHGAVSIEERKQRLGQYYTVLWNADADAQKVIVFRYRQASSGSRIKEMCRSLPIGEVQGKEEFTIIGDNYFDNGRVLAWKLDLTANGKTIASKQSYLWE